MNICVDDIKKKSMTVMEKNTLTGTNIDDLKNSHQTTHGFAQIYMQE